jgi:hypothetical protein
MKLEAITSDAMSALTVSPLCWIVDGLIREEALIYISGDAGTFKSGFCLFLSLCITSKEECLGKKILKPTNVLFIDEENGIRMTKAYHDRLKNTMGIKTTGKIFYIACEDGFKLTKTPGYIGINELETFIKENSIGLVIIDNISRVFTGEEHHIEDVRKIHGWLKPIMTKYHCSIIIIHHNKKGDPAFGKTASDMRGSVDFLNQCDQQFIFENVGKPDWDSHSRTFSCKCEKLKGGFAIEGFNFVVKGETDSPELRVIWGGSITENVEMIYDKCKEEIRVLLSKGGLTVTDLKSKIPRKAETVTHCLQEMVREDEIEITKIGNAKVHSLKSIPIIVEKEGIKKG